MAQLSNDCFAFGGALRPLDDALDDLTQRLKVVVGHERVTLDLALDRVLAEDVSSTVLVPSFDNSAVDGYAVRFADLAPNHESRLPVVGRVPAGMRNVPALVAGTARRIFTGAMMPPGADTIFMQEDALETDGFVTLPPGLALGSNRRFAGEDFSPGDVLLRAGTRLHPAHLASLAAMGHQEVKVWRPLRVGILSTGNEIVAPGEILVPGTQFDSNRFLLAGLLRARGMVPVPLGIVADERTKIVDALQHAASVCDAILTSGGVSTGEEDHVKAALDAAGRMDFWRLAIKPGRPVAMGFVAGTPMIGLPGNPVAAFVTFTRFAGPVLDCLSGALPHRPRGIPVIAGFSYKKKQDRREYVRVCLRYDDEGRAIAEKFNREGAALLSSLIGSDGLLELPESMTRLNVGESVPFLSFSGLIA